MIDNADAQQLVEILKEKGLKIASAESLTGGMVSGLITSIPGASDVFECGICSYSNRIKNQLIGVSQKTLDRYTEYSEQTAREMAEGIKKIAGADIGISTTGIAGPGGGSEDKPVGLVYIGICTTECTAYKFDFSENGKNDRNRIRELAAIKAIDLAKEAATFLTV